MVSGVGVRSGEPTRDGEAMSGKLLVPPAVPMPQLYRRTGGGAGRSNGREEGGRELGSGGREERGNRGRRKRRFGLVWLTRRCRPHGRAAKTRSMDQSPVGRRQSARANRSRGLVRRWARCSQVMAQPAGGGQPPSTGAATEAVSVSERQRRAWPVLGWPVRLCLAVSPCAARRWLPAGRPDVVGIPAASSSSNGVWIKKISEF